MNIGINETPLPGCFLITLPEQKDKRGSFVKIFHAETFEKNGLETIYLEEYYSISRHGVLRGLHFQVPPQEHIKLVCCLEGVIFDAVVDLRMNSPTIGKFTTCVLKGDGANLLYIPPGMAHGYLVQSETALVFYKVSTMYSPAHDRGILWNSVGIPWPAQNPVVSARDKTFPTLAGFESPFVYNTRMSI